MSAINSMSSSAPARVQGSARLWLDRLGIGASLACAVHCLAAPFLLLLLPAAGSVWAHPLVHWVLAVLVLPLALWVIYNGYRKHRKRWTLIAAGLGSAFIIAGLISPMVSAQPVFVAQLPSWGSPTPVVAAAADEHATCTDACCPSVVHDAKTGTASLSIPPGGLITLIGSLLLVAAHMTNLVACRCHAKVKKADVGEG